MCVGMPVTNCLWCLPLNCGTTVGVPPYLQYGRTHRHRNAMLTTILPCSCTSKHQAKIKARQFRSRHPYWCMRTALYTAATVSVIAPAPPFPAAAAAIAAAAPSAPAATAALYHSSNGHLPGGVDRGRYVNTQL